jgi:hypothetical protein
MLVSLIKLPSWVLSSPFSTTVNTVKQDMMQVYLVGFVLHAKSPLLPTSSHYSKRSRVKKDAT